MKRTFKIPVSWQVEGYVEVEAESIEEALELVIKKENSDNPYDLPDNGDYLENSFVIEKDLDAIECYNA